MDNGLDLQAIRERAEKAKPDGKGAVTRARYDHGGGRMYQDEGPDTGRELILDTYEEPSREFYFNARDDVLALCDHIDAYEAERQKMIEALEAALVAFGSCDCKSVYCSNCGPNSVPAKIRTALAPSRGADEGGA